MSEQEDVSIKFTLMLNNALAVKMGRGPCPLELSERVDDTAPLLIQCDNEATTQLFLNIIMRLKNGTLDAALLLDDNCEVSE